MREWEIGAVENIHGALPYIRFAPILALVGVGINRIGKLDLTPPRLGPRIGKRTGCYQFGCKRQKLEGARVQDISILRGPKNEDFLVNFRQCTCHEIELAAFPTRLSVIRGLALEGRNNA